MGEEKEGELLENISPFRVRIRFADGALGSGSSRADFPVNCPPIFRKLNINISTIKHLVFIGNEG